MTNSISIHAPYAGSDAWKRHGPTHSYDFNPRSLCGERLPKIVEMLLMILFQSTLPMRGATIRSASPGRPGEKFQSTLPMRGATSNYYGWTPALEISIHAPYAGSDTSLLWQNSTPIQFQSTLPMRGATPLMGTATAKKDFNPRSLCGERRKQMRIFNETFPISIHAPYAGSDGVVQQPGPDRRAISIHAPYAGSDALPPRTDTSQVISIHAPYAGSDRFDLCRLSPTFISIHAPYAGSDQQRFSRWDGYLISIHAPYAGSDCNIWR